VQGTRNRQGRLTPPLLATLFGVLFGVLAMHGLSVHGTTQGAGTASTPSPTMATLEAAHAAHGHEDAFTAGASASASGHEAPEPPETGPASLAMLGLLAALVLAALQRGRPLRPMALLPRPGSAPLPRGRLPRPPCLHALSILRC
jgi:hypothetical protein